MLTADALAFFASHHGVAPIDVLVRRGVSPSTIVRQVRAGTLVRCGRNVVRIASARPTLESRCAAACFAWPRAVVAGPTAGILWDLRRMPHDGLVHLRVRHPDRTPHGPGIEGHRTRRLDADEIVQRADGIRLLSRARTAFDLAATLGERDLSSVHEQLLSQDQLVLADLAALGDRLAHVNRPGSARFQDVVGRRTGTGAAESHLEVLLGQMLREAGVPIEHRQRWLELPNGTRIRIDLGVDVIRWGVEADHSAWHAGRFETWRDKSRDRLARLVGWQLDHVTEDDLERNPRATIDQLVLLYLLRTAEVCGREVAHAEARRLGRPGVV